MLKAFCQIFILYVSKIFSAFQNPFATELPHCVAIHIAIVIKVIIVSNFDQMLIWCDLGKHAFIDPRVHQKGGQHTTIISLSYDNKSFRFGVLPLLGLNPGRRKLRLVPTVPDPNRMLPEFFRKCSQFHHDLANHSVSRKSFRYCNASSEAFPSLDIFMMSISLREVPLLKARLHSCPCVSSMI